MRTRSLKGPGCEVASLAVAVCRAVALDAHVLFARPRRRSLLPRVATGVAREIVENSGRGKRMAATVESAYKMASDESL